MAKAKAVKRKAQPSDKMAATLTTGDVARDFGVSIDTVRRWHMTGVLTPFYIDTKGVRWYTNKQIAAFGKIREQEQARESNRSSRA